MTTKGTPTSADQRGVAPCSMGRPPQKAPMALPRLNATCMAAPPSSSPPGACLSIRNCCGLLRANRQPVHTTISAADIQP